MLSYYLQLAWLSLKKTPVLSSLMVLAIAIGIGSCMTSITIHYLMSADPIPHKSDKLFYVRLDSVGLNSKGLEDGWPPHALTWNDSVNLLRDAKASRQAFMDYTASVVETEGKEPYVATIRLTSADFFPLFDVPFQYGQGWDHQDDLNEEQVMVISHELNQILFDGQNSVGKEINYRDRIFKVIGVLKPWTPSPRFYDTGFNADEAFEPAEEIFLPILLKKTMQLPSYSTGWCWKEPDSDDYLSSLLSECSRFLYWVELEDAQQQQAYMDYLEQYVLEQKKLGRFERPINNRISNVMQHLAYHKVVSEDNKILMWLSFMFLLVCLLNTVTLMLSKLNHRTTEIALRRALGANKQQLFSQCITESVLIGLLGSALGFVFTWLGLQFVEKNYGSIVQELSNLDPVLIVLTILLSIVSAVGAALYPTYKACNTDPAPQLKA